MTQVIFYTLLNLFCLSVFPISIGDMYIAIGSIRKDAPYCFCIAYVACLDQETEQHTGSTSRTDNTGYIGTHGIHEQVVGGVGLLTLVV